MIALINNGLLEVFLKRLYIQVIYDLSQDSESVRFEHFILVLAHILCQLTDNYEYLILICFQFLSYTIKTHSSLP